MAVTEIVAEADATRQDVLKVCAEAAKVRQIVLKLAANAREPAWAFSSSINPANIISVEAGLWPDAASVFKADNITATDPLVSHAPRP